MEGMQQQAQQQQQHAPVGSAKPEGGEGSGHQPAGERMHEAPGPSPGGAATGDGAAGSNGSAQQPQRTSADGGGPQHAGFYYGYDSLAPGLPQQYRGPSAYPTGYPPPGWTPSMPNR